MGWNILIVEDEDWAFVGLKEMLTDLYGDSTLTFTNTKEIQEAVKTINKHHFDLIFMDIHLMDGLSFEIFKQVSIDVPLIFTTAYEQYALEAFQNQGYAYLLKPFDVEELAQIMKRLEPLLPKTEPRLKQRFLVKYGNFLKSLAIADIAYFMAEDKELYAVEKESGVAYIIEDSLVHLVTQVDPFVFFKLIENFLFVLIPFSLC
ncbi:response regulator [Sphingobacterium sp. E70]|uniref:LytR/AlgR family response regulator transcription factor n=1 Tax=Sphingobacterium sp. E70 TaxID=2853439 RepID=UPI00211BBC83|nr:response regulator [Sphingobacterium sp. E70]ULT27119.1 response regulator [Sphingobacterium sp. E70]